MESQISESEFQFDDFSTVEFNKNPTGISRIGNGIRIPQPMGVPEIKTKNQNFQPRQRQRSWQWQSWQRGGNGRAVALVVDRWWHWLRPWRRFLHGEMQSKDSKMGGMWCFDSLEKCYNYGSW